MNIKLKDLSEQDTIELLGPNKMIHFGYRGSISHGMYVPSSDPNSIDDKDVMGVFLYPPEYYIGLKEGKGVHERFIGCWDSVSYELRKFTKLCLKGNPNVLGILWLDDEFVIDETESFKKLKSVRHAFASKQAYHSFVGYAGGQLKRMTHLAFEGYMGEKRKSLVQKFGYDCKNAAHLIRLLRMGIEFLTEGTLYVKRKDSQELLAIKRGEWNLEEVKEEARKLFDFAKQAYLSSPLPAQPDNELVGQIMMEIIKASL